MAKAKPRAGELTTANYSWTKPTVGASNDAWGGYINADLDSIDSTVHGIDTRTASAPYVPQAGYVPAMNDNRIINGNFAVNQRAYVSGTALAAAAYGHDRWKAGASGCTYTFTAALPDTTIMITAGSLTQIIEAGVIEGGVHTLSWTGTAQARVYQGTPIGSYAASPIITASLTAGTNTIVEFNAGTVVRVKFEIGSVATAFNRQSLAKSMADCQRYYTVTQFAMLGYATAGAYIGGPCFFPVAMRAVPTIVIGSAIGTDANVGTVGTPDTISTLGFRMALSAAVAGVVSAARGISASAEL